TVRTGPARFRVTIHEPLQIKKGKATPGDVQAVVEAITRFIEDRVREVPGQWFWMHRRWPKSANRPTQAPPSTDATP
ncbi:MAG: lipid A biosynthesis acyltransferase, partial [Pseudomonadota bacterium]